MQIFHVSGSGAHRKGLQPIEVFVGVALLHSILGLELKLRRGLAVDNVCNGVRAAVCAARVLSCEAALRNLLASGLVEVLVCSIVEFRRKLVRDG